MNATDTIDLPAADRFPMFHHEDRRARDEARDAVLRNDGSGKDAQTRSSLRDRRWFRREKAAERLRLTEKRRDALKRAYWHTNEVRAYRDRLWRLILRCDWRTANLEGLNGRP